MQLGMIGLGRMGANIVRRIMRDGHTAVAFDTNPDTVAQLAGEGAVGADSLEDFVQKLEKPRVAWVMIPAGITDKVVQQVADLMEEGDIIINGGNSNYREDYDRAAALATRGIHYLDVGTSSARGSARATRSSTAATPTSRTTSGAPRNWRRRASPTSTRARAAACGASSAATA